MGMKIKLALLLISSSLLTACGYLNAIPGADRVIGEEGMFRDRQGDYLEAETIPRTVIPDGLDAYVIDDLLVVPDSTTDDVEAFLVVPRPRTINSTPQRGVVIQTMNEESWIVVNASASQVWPRIRDYWGNSGIGLSYENPTAGILETEWFVLADNTLTREKIRAIVEPGFQNNSSEIKLLHLSSAQATPVGLTQELWPETSMDPDVEYDLLSSLSGYLVDVADLYQASSVSFLAGNISTGGKANMTTSAAGDSVLRLNSDYARSWAAIGRALDRAGIEVLAENRETGTYNVNYSIGSEEEEKRGIFGKIITLNGVIGGSSNDLDEQHLLQIKVLDQGEAIDVTTERSEPGAEQSEAAEEAKESLLLIIKDFIA